MLFVYYFSVAQVRIEAIVLYRSRAIVHVRDIKFEKSSLAEIYFNIPHNFIPSMNRIFLRMISSNFSGIIAVYTWLKINISCALRKSAITLPRMDILKRN